MCLAIPGKIESMTGDEPLIRTGKVVFGGIARDVSLAYVPEAKVGDYVIVHVGFAISIVDEQEAMQIFKDLEELSAAESS
ncbi:MAG TPA: hydrogenase assembly protein HupF [Verrucomicrobia bacterium]|nr:MAG: hydrogenase assembly protein HupF [Lentisphaerae bacterium GWF2_57_35]HBA83868.1 hydrogenase assembly protein HupF [Verrucomicrobiota bacterium]